MGTAIHLLVRMDSSIFCIHLPKFLQITHIVMVSELWFLHFRDQFE